MTAVLTYLRLLTRLPEVLPKEPGRSSSKIQILIWQTPSARYLRVRPPIWARSPVTRVLSARWPRGFRVGLMLRWQKSVKLIQVLLSRLSKRPRSQNSVTSMVRRFQVTEIQAAKYLLIFQRQWALDKPVLPKLAPVTKVNSAGVIFTLLCFTRWFGFPPSCLERFALMIFPILLEAFL